MFFKHENFTENYKFFIARIKQASTTLNLD